MRRPIGNLTVFLMTFAIGSVATNLIILQAAKLIEPAAPDVAEVWIESVSIAHFDFSEPPVFNPNVDYSGSLKVKLLQSGAYHSEEVPYRSGERWLGLFREGESYVLRWTTIVNRRINNDGLFNREISTSDSNSSVFLLRGADKLAPGKVDTVFDLERDGSFALGEQKSFGFRGSFWRLWLENGDPREDGYAQEGSALKLQRNSEIVQVLRTVPNGCNECGWTVLWIGDLDGDSNLDFLIDVSGHYNVYEPTLFLSSPGGYVRVYGGFRGVGC
jgi:hypothetical protein